MPSLSSIFAVIGVVLTIVYIALQFHLRSTQDAREPPVIETAFPYITPAIGLSKNTYFDYLRYSSFLAPCSAIQAMLTTHRKRYANLPIYTLRLPGQRFYVINDPQLISAVQRQYKILSFQFVEDSMAHKMFNISPVTKALLKREADAWRNGPSNVPSPAHAQFKALAPGKDLDNMNRIMLKSLEESMNDWVPQNSQSLKTPLFEWVKEVLFVPTTNGVYGPENPYRDSGARNNYWSASILFTCCSNMLSLCRTFFSGIPTMIKVGRWFAKDSVAAIDRLGSTWKRYFQQGSHKRHSGFIQKYYEYYTERDFPYEDYSQLMVGSAVAVLGNTLPTGFWWVLRLFSDRKVLEACREEILAQVTHDKDETGNPVQTLDITALKTSCPLLSSAFKEVLRLDAVGTGVRGVEEDHMLDGKYLLRKNALIFMPLVSQHYDHDRWGADAEEYCFDRFTDKTRPRVSNVSFRSFGGGTTLCPGRHFVTTELLAFAAMLLLRFEIVPSNGKWVIPTSGNAEMTTNMPAPDFDIDVEIRRRADDEGIKWVWRLSESEQTVMLADQDEYGNEKA